MSQSPPPTRHYDLELMLQVEKSLDETPFEGMRIGATLTDTIIIDLVNEVTRFGPRQRCIDRLRWLKYRFLSSRRGEMPRESAAGKILVTWRTANARWNELNAPVVRQLGPERCAVIYSDPNVVPLLPAGTAALHWEKLFSHDSASWPKAFFRCWPKWKRALRQVCREQDLPCGAFERLAFQLLVNSQVVLAFQDLLRRWRPEGIIAEYDRGSIWSCLVLAAEKLQIPTFGLVHGVFADPPVGYRSTLADVLFCWGQRDRQQFLNAGDDERKLVLGGCPRLTRELSATKAEARARLGLDAARPVGLLATGVYPDDVRNYVVEVFCAGIERSPGVTGVVRLHASEKLADYAAAIKRHPTIRFAANGEATVDEAIAAADVVVVNNSGFGSDALVKRRLVAVIDVPGAILGHGAVLTEQARCPRVTTAEEMAAALNRMLHDDEYWQQLSAAAENYVGRFCAYFGDDSAHKIAESVWSAVRRPAAASANIERSSQAVSS